jgi:O-acetyl-ADP-ribose deacetylase (regulator of RNase III)
MIRYTTGNLLTAEAEALVNTVNEVGVMGKGIALMFREAFPVNMQEYEEACKAGNVHVGEMLVTENNALVGPRWIINFPTKKHWRHPSKMEWIQSGLKDLARVIEEKGIRSIALPPLGCGQGGLEWQQVRPEIERALSSLEGVDILVYQPTKEYQNKPKEIGVTKLTPARALIAELVRRYSVLGMDCTNLEIQKLAWFLDRMVQRYRLTDQLKLKFKPQRYGPYADNLRHLLDSLDGSYLHGDKRLADAGVMDLIHFEDTRRDELESYLNSPDGRVYSQVLESTTDLIEGFESPYGMELLATIDWLLLNEKCLPTVEAIQDGLAHWPAGPDAAARKQKLFDERSIGLAIDRLTQSELWKQPAS